MVHNPTVDLRAAGFIVENRFRVRVTVRFAQQSELAVMMEQIWMNSGEAGRLLQRVECSAVPRRRSCPGQGALSRVAVRTRGDQQGRFELSVS